MVCIHFLPDECFSCLPQIMLQYGVCISEDNGRFRNYVIFPDLYFSYRHSIIHLYCINTFKYTSCLSLVYRSVCNQNIDITVYNVIIYVVLTVRRILKTNFYLCARNFARGLWFARDLSQIFFTANQSLPVNNDMGVDKTLS